MTTSSSGTDVSTNSVYKRSPGPVIAPLKYTNDLFDFDHWDHMFMTNCCKSLTLHDFDEPPSRVLDLGCGRGLWAIAAARQWQGSTVVGFDIADVQPPLSVLEEKTSRRLKWVHGNILDELPFDDCQFDFVRMVRVGLHIPVYEWAHVLQEISRVLKVHGVFEIIEEDPIFPCQTFQGLDGYPTNVRSSSNSSPRSSNTAVASMGSSMYLKSDPSPGAIGPRSSSADAFSTIGSPLSAFETEMTQSRPNPRNHPRLKRAWEELLDDRHLAPNLTSILPSKLKVWFGDIRSHPPLQIALPPSSTQRRGSTPITCGLPSLIDPDAVFELSPIEGKSSLTDLDDDCNSVTTKKSSQRGVSSWASMHLARTVRTIAGCKESIWEAYEKLYGQDPSLPYTVRSAQEKYLKRNFNEAQSPASPLRDYFESDWINWQNDMTDRARLRDSIRAELSWSEPRGGLPEWRIWRNSLSSQDVETKPEEKLELCRNLRGFVCFNIPEIANAK
ncbi:hypothetical protein F5J12DRAFT_456230 [Pisolithus orientalis]|uniref:uncharacterized protein n=1 Tax=Pisolithus orientalis TaxID=936130 RepID=UPI0022258E8E|nr:uncharacterized protein F5J12DRAFT_456230 [Pisolithus orientalis]KAI6025964.1 hypothetical protein F5J12DRAFT_456230 [Pisolithus orientalis]